MLPGTRPSRRPPVGARRDARGGEVVFYDEGPAGTVAVIEQQTPRGSFRRLYIHQEEAVRAVLEGRHTLLSAATGRGKTEGWLLPILQRTVEARDVHLKSPSTAARVAMTSSTPR